MIASLGAVTRPFAEPDSVVVYEVQSAAGVPDAVFLALDLGVLASRRSLGFLTEPAMLGAVVALSRAQARGEALETGEVAGLLGVTRGHAATNVLPVLESQGYAARGAGGGWSAVQPFRSVARSVVTVEAKLRDWKRGLGQATRHAAGADRSWLVIDAASATAARKSREWFTALGVGLAALDVSGHVTTLVEPRRADVLPLRRELLAERAAAIYAAGDASGPVRPVFGRILAPTTGPDPRLAGAGAR